MMPKFKNVSPVGELELPTLGFVVPAGGVVDVDDATAEGFLLQPDVWKPIDSKKEA
jgi:hypothetical protein